VKVIFRNLIAGALAFALVTANPSLARLGAKGGGSSTGGPTCPYGSSYPDGCPSSGLFYAPIAGATVPIGGSSVQSVPGSLSRPTAAQWAAHAAVSGQVWSGNHPQPWNLAGVDYPSGLTTLFTSLADVASWTPGFDNCTYTASGYAGVAGWPTNSPVLVCSGATSGSFSPSAWNFGPTAFQATPFGASHDCVTLLFKPTNGNTDVAPYNWSNIAFINGAACGFKISGVNYGQVALNAIEKSPFTFQNIYIDGRADDPGGCCLNVFEEWISLNSFEASFTFQYGYAVDMGSAVGVITFATGNESAFPCSNGTSSPATTAPGYSLNVSDSYFDAIGVVGGAGHNETFTMNLTGIMCLASFAYNTVPWPAATSAAGTASFFFQANNLGTIEAANVTNNSMITNLTGGKQLPELYDFYNWYTNGLNPDQIVIQGNGSSCSILPWGGTCSNAVRGELVTGGTNNAANSIPVLQTITGSVAGAGCNSQDTNGICPFNGNLAFMASFYTTTGGASSTFTMGSTCPTNLAGTTVSDITQGGAAVGTVLTCSGSTLTLTGTSAITVGSSDLLNFGIVYPSGAPSTFVQNGLFNNRQMSLAAGSAEHGADFINTGLTAGANGSTGSPSVTLSGNCPSGAANAVINDTTASQIVGVILSCPTAGAVATLYSNAAFAVTSGDALTIASFGYGVVTYKANYIDGVGSGEAQNLTPAYWAASPTVSSGTGWQSGAGGGCFVPATVSGNVELRNTPAYASASVLSATYTSATGILSMTFATAPLGSSPPASAIDTFVTTSGFTTSAGSASNVNGLFPILSTASAGTVLNVLAASGLGTITINSGTGTLAAGGGNSSFPQVNQLQVQAGGC
jgi:hypothetical protein